VIGCITVDDALCFSFYQDICSALRAERIFEDDMVHWLSTTAWNQAIDSMCASHPHESREWAETALIIANFHPNSRLSEMVQNSYDDLKQFQSDETTSDEGGPMDAIEVD